ncbi:major facilitator superfamily protein [Candidatus Planktophila limnetica]|uniref:Major facilitator superfamily protein n=1 Tax=Candidatus Planktophila limnetica TaxID=573600 RepID=A0A249LH92_9ACTN|nr:MFS transporter [Candidatus Planktophila limnetica]ASY28304.1 major facilitator superfamily protein [Candidatus Planktophila limnetica]
MNFWELLRHPRLSRLLGVRWSGQATDGLFQSALASFVLFSPERQADALSAAIGFAVVLLPYSLVGPFVGTILDRVSRQRALLFSNLARAANLLVVAALVFTGQTGVVLTVFVLIAFGVNRLILAGLSAGLPLVIETKSLISANALAVTGGSVLVVLGGGLGVAIRNLFDNLAVADHADAIMVLFAAGGYLSAALLTLRVGKKEIGPLPHEVKEASFKEGINEMREGFAFLRTHSDAIRGIIATAVQRGGITALTLTALLLERNTFNSPSNPEAGLAGFGIVLTIAGVGITLGALTAPYGVKRFGRHRWIKWSLLVGAAGPIFLVVSQTEIALALTGFFVALCGQNVKVTNDALVQSKIDDYYRGRVFAVYDVLVNAAIVSGGLIAALMLPTSGVTPWVPALVSASYLLVALRLLRPEKFFLKN